LLILDDSAFSNDILIIIKLWGLSADVHFHGDLNSVRVFGDNPVTILRFNSTVYIVSTTSTLGSWWSSRFVHTFVWNSLWSIKLASFVPNTWSGTSSSGVVLPTGAVYLSIHCESRGWTEGNWRNESLTSGPDALTFLFTRLLVQLRKAGWSKLVPIVSGWWMAEVILKEWSINIDFIVLGNC
jgi:hypothetical protein